MCLIIATERLAATKKEVAVLHARFEAELARQAAKAAEVAEQVIQAGNETQRASGTDRRGGDGLRKRGGGTLSRRVTAGGTLADDSSALDTSKSRSSKKKTRSSAATNTPGTHQLRNYSRVSRTRSIPILTAAQVAMAAQNSLGPPPLRFLMADLRPRDQTMYGGVGGGGGGGISTPNHNTNTNTKSTGGVPSLSSTLLSSTSSSALLLANQLPAALDEWICPFCEYDLFYGQEAGLRRAMRNRKKILSRRRRARERAAAAASGALAPALAPLSASASAPVPASTAGSANGNGHDYGTIGGGGGGGSGGGVGGPDAAGGVTAKVLAPPSSLKRDKEKGGRGSRVTGE
jgi:hypothetical protein